MKALRRSMKGDKHKQSPSIGSKSAFAIVPPKKVIRAIDDYHPDDDLVQNFAKAGVQVLGFSKGDFFHVIGREDDARWYEACNPALPDARGLVPVDLFQVLGRNERDSAQSDGSKTPILKSPDHDSGYGDTTAPPLPPVPSQRTSRSMRPAGTVYAKVRYAFTTLTQRPDELSAEEGENLIIVAQSNHEWVIAKPIMRLGGPGLIPISFIDVFDEPPLGTDPNNPPTPVADPLEALRRAGVPSVEDWKQMAAQYKNSSITLGKFDGVSSPPSHQPGIEQGMSRLSLQSGGRQSHQNGSRNHGYHNYSTSGQHSIPGDSSAGGSPPHMPAPVMARIPRYCFGEDKYWFVIEAKLEDGRCWELSRYYQDFYDFQIALLAEFPAEAGNTSTQKRTLPYMPGPVNYVTDAITEGRLYNLDAYIKNLLNQPPHISRCDLVKLFFKPREGDYEIDPGAFGDDEYRMSESSHQSSAESPGNAASVKSSSLASNGYSYSGLPPAPRPGGGHPQGMTAPQEQPPAAAMKIKVRYKEDVFAMRVATDIIFEDLFDRVQERIKAAPGEEIALFYLDEQSSTLQSLASTEDLDLALQRNEKLTIYCEVA
ncbi:hypothetical protein CDD82_7642 [Ophiocordyceps australis]|uniref:Uncharacterized protein n=1 Tax=Ophiocordyceps australis TaxID=1399860 RepID=A0A2C5ZPG8_9HYPO|nr:hypothetical protein CDD82_7642 [Ophiocordyceps australis]